ncbi:MAG: sigma-54-dependent transcriptional regulator [Gammaproteobacteria bacterium]
MSGTLLIIEDEALLGQELARHFRNAGYVVEWADNLAKARDLLFRQSFDPNLILSDMNLPDGNALDFMEQVQSRVGSAQWTFLSGYGSIPDSVRALRLGAFDFLEKPCDLGHLDLVVASAARSAKVQRQLLDQAENQHRRYCVDAFVGHSSTAQNVRNLLSKLIQIPISALIIGGETGTGKGLVAKILHYNGSRGRGPLIEINCAALPREIMESELFGHEVGAFTGATTRHRGVIEQADGGTLFLDEIAEMPLDLQAKLLKAIEDRRIRRLGSQRELSVNLQVIAASNRDLKKMAEEEGTFRSDLYHRLSVFKLTLPPLRKIKEDLDDLVPLLVAEYNAKSAKQVRIIPDEVWNRLRAYEWPGNVRELRNVIERCVLFSDGQIFPLEWLQLPGQAEERGESPTHRGEEDDGLVIPLDGNMNLDDMDRFIIQNALERAQFNISAAARALGTTRETLRYRIRKYGLDTKT